MSLLNRFDFYSRYNIAQLELSGEVLEEQQNLNLPFLTRDNRFTIHELHRIFSHIRLSSLKGLILKIKNISVGFARANEIRYLISELCTSGKKVFVYLEAPGNIEYFIASSADKIFIPPWSTLNLIGIAAETYFIRDLLEKLEIESEIKGFGEYKSSAEMFNRDSMSKAHKEMVENILDNHYNKISDMISKNRNIKKKELLKSIDLAPFTPEEAKNLGFVDEICYEADIENYVNDSIDEKVMEINYKKLNRIIRVKEFFYNIKSKLNRSSNKIGLIAISGIITLGKSRSSGNGMKTSGSDSVIENLKKASNDKNIAAVVLRVISPGGSAIASDLIRNEVEQLSKKKPVVVSMSDVAASGGYMVSLGGNKILADLFTLTGSIGVVSGKFNFKGFLEKLGVTSERISKGKMATLFSVNKSFTKDEETKFNTMMSDMYNSFVNLVSKSRNLDYDKAESASKGRVWTSFNAKELGLIDNIGGLKDAINEAHKMSDLPLRDFPNVKVIATKQKIALGSLLKFNSLFNRKLDVIDLMQNFNKERFLTVMSLWIKIV